MMLNPRKRSAAVEQVAHYLIGFTLIMKGISKLDHFHHHPLSIIVIFAAGAFIMLGTFFHHPLSRRIPNFTALFHFAEGIALILVGAILLEKGARIPYFLFFVGVIYLVMGTIQFFSGAEQKERILPRVQLVVGILFVLGGFAAVTYNLLDDNNMWMHIVSGIMISAGVFLLIFRRRARISSL